MTAPARGSGYVGVGSWGTYKLSAKDDPVSVEGEAVRVLKRQGDGFWKFAVVGLK